MCYYFKETEKISKFFMIAIVVVLIVGFFAGIGCGAKLKEPTKDAIEALQNITLYPTLAKNNHPEWYETAEETGWTVTGVGLMLSVWASSAIAALLLYGKKHQIELSDMTAGEIKNIEAYVKNVVALQQKSEEPSEDSASVETV